jgi:hypothetical protein
MNKLKFYKRDFCPACNCKNSKNILSINKERLFRFLNFYYKKNLNELIDNYKYILKECLNCNFIYQEFVLDNLSAKFFYKYIEKQNPKNKDKFSNYEIKNINFANYLKANYFKKEIEILDFGSGYTNYKKTNTELNFDTFDIADDNNSDMQIKFDSLLQKKYDLIFLNQVFEHVSEPKELIIMLNNLLKKNGILKIEFPSSNMIFYKILLLKIFGFKKTLLHEIFPIEHVNCFSNTSLKIFFENFTPLKFDYELFSKDQIGMSFFKFLKYLMIKNVFIKSFFTVCTFKNGGNYFLLKKN